MRKLFVVLFCLLPWSAVAQVINNQGEELNLCRVWDGTDVGLIDGSGNFMVGDGTGPLTVDGTLTCNAGSNLNTSALALDATVTGRLPAGASPADNESNTNTNLSRIGNYNFVFDGTQWDRWTGTVTVSNSFLLDATYTGRTPAGASPADNESNTNTALSRVGVFNFVFDGTTWDRWTGAVTANAGTNLNTSSLALDATLTGRLPAGASPADNESNTNTNLSRIGAFGFIFDGSTWDRWTGAVTSPTAANFNNRPDTSGATGSAVPARADYIGGTDGTNLRGFFADPCSREVRSVYRVNISTATTTEIAAAVASEFYWICSINLVTAAANNVAIVEDDTATNCPSPTAGVSTGGTTAASGWNFGANGGIVIGTGQNWIMKTGTANRSICIITSASTQLSGTITYVSDP